jgi:hypothetical protein
MPSKSKSQQRLMGWAKSIKEKGKDSKEYKEAPQNIKDIVDSMTLKELDDFAETKHKGLPEEVKSKKNESLLHDFKSYKKIYEINSDKGYPYHIDEMPNIAGIEEEEFETIVIVEDENGIQFAVEEQLLDEFLEDNPNFVSTIVHPPLIAVIAKYGRNKEFNIEIHTVKYENGEWIFPEIEIFIGE